MTPCSCQWNRGGRDKGRPRIEAVKCMCAFQPLSLLPQVHAEDSEAPEDGKATIRKELGALNNPGENHLTARGTCIGWLDEGEIKFCCIKPLKCWGLSLQLAIFLTQCCVGESKGCPWSTQQTHLQDHSPQELISGL